MYNVDHHNFKASIPSGLWWSLCGPQFGHTKHKWSNSSYENSPFWGRKPWSRCGSFPQRADLEISRKGIQASSRAGWLRQKHAPPWAQCFLSPACWAWETNWRQTTSANQWPRLLITESHQVRVWCGYGSKPWYPRYSKTAAWWMFIPGLVIS